MTELLFYPEPDLHIFKAEVVTAEDTDKGLRVILNRTAFYPEGGGQPADRGTLNGHPVIDVQKDNDEVYHYLQHIDGEILPSTGEIVEGIIEAEHRLDYMQQHTGQHLVSAAMMRAAEIQTVSVRQGTEYTAIETSTSDISPELIRQIEDQANSYIRAKAPIIRHITDEEGLKSFKLRRPTKHNSNIKIVTIPGIDCVACGGMHLKTTAEVGLIKYIYHEKLRGHVRTFWKIGKRAYDDYNEKTEIINSLNEFYSARQFELVQKAETAAEQYTETRYKYNKLEEDYAALFASIIRDDSKGAAIKIFENKTKGFITSLVRSLAADNSSPPAFIFNHTDEALTWAIACSDADFDFNSFRSSFLPIISGKGGGKAPLWQGIAKDPGGLDKLIDKIKENWVIEA